MFAFVWVLSGGGMCRETTPLTWLSKLFQDFGLHVSQVMQRIDVI